MDGPGRELTGLGHDLQLISELEVAPALREPGVFFTPGELARFAAAVSPLESLAGGFAAKEALFKALPPARATWFWTEAELVHDPRGAPRFRAHGTLAAHLDAHRLRVDVSLSHSGGFVSAVVLVTARPPGGGTPLGTLIGFLSRAVGRVLQRNPAHTSGAPQ
ncbi:holo-ACP synthase [Streptomyces physcomitrii]|uniref:holo-ACP synthase n=1 Tax=Streptomyces physcomitrii TaxID=2724184 RepID=UPI0033C825D5